MRKKYIFKYFEPASKFFNYFVYNSNEIISYEKFASDYYYSLFNKLSLVYYRKFCTFDMTKNKIHIL